MLSIFPSSSFPTHSGWLSEEPLIHDQSYLWTDSAGGASEPFSKFSSLQPSPHVKLETCSPSAGGDGRGGAGDPSVLAKKLKHNASERDRRKKMNSLYSSLRSLLPLADRTKRMSNPTTISRALKYIPELEQQVERLRRRKQGLVTKKIAAATDREERERKTHAAPWSCVCGASWVSETEALLQITSDETLQLPFSQLLLSLEEDGLLILSASSFQSLHGRLFFTLLLQVKKNSTSRVLQEILKMKL